MADLGCPARIAVPQMARFDRCIATALGIVICGCHTAGSQVAPSVSSRPTVSRAPESAKNESNEKWTPFDQTRDNVDSEKSEDIAAGIELAAAVEFKQTVQNAYEGVATQTETGTPLELADALAAGLEQNPDLIAQREADAVGRAQLGVAQTYPFNPFVQVQATPWQQAQEGGPGTTYHYVLLMQTIQCAHQQRFREQAAAATLNSIRWNIHQFELLNVAQTERLFFNALYLRGVRDLADATATNNDQLLTTLQKQLDAGNATGADVAIIRLDAASTARQARLADANYRTALRDFRRHLGLPVESAIEPPGDLRDYQWHLPDAKALQGDDISMPVGENLADAIGTRAESRPDVLAAQCDANSARGALSLATASKTPDLQVGPYYQRTADGTTFLGFRAQMDIPVINSGAPLERQRYAEYKQRVTIWQQLKVRATLEAQAAFERYEVALNALAQFDQVNRDVPRELTKLEEQFRAGEIDILRVIQSRTSLIQNQRALLDFLNEAAQAAANLTAAAGIPPEQLVRKSRD